MNSNASERPRTFSKQSKKIGLRVNHPKRLILKEILVEAVGIKLLNKLIKSSVFTVLTTASQANWANWGQVSPAHQGVKSEGSPPR